MFAAINSIGLFGLNAFHVDVEISISKGMPRFEIVGLGGTAVQESRERVKAALLACDLTFPAASCVVNLAPADTRKNGSMHDLPIFLAFLAAMECIRWPADSAAIGELSLNGAVKPVLGVLPMVLEAKRSGIRTIFLPAGNAAEAAVVEGITVYGVSTARELLAHLDGSHPLTPAVYDRTRTEPPPYPDFSDVRGQRIARSAMEIAAAGGHNLLLMGPPGSGKSMLAKRLPGILPEMTFDEAIEASMVHSVAGLLDAGHPLLQHRPFRSPHHSISAVGLAGGGSIPRPGEISLAHNGVLFLDEMAEFDRKSLEILRQPLEDHCITVSRAAYTLTYPSSIMLVGAMNPCPCGYAGHPRRRCICRTDQISRYLSRISGPLLDRFDLHVHVSAVKFDDLANAKPGESTAEIRKRVIAAREIQRERFKGTSITCNARIEPGMIQKYCPAEDQALVLMRQVFEKLNLSARAYDRVLKVARTIADLKNREVIRSEDISYATTLRALDKAPV